MWQKGELLPAAIESGWCSNRAASSPLRERRRIRAYEFRAIAKSIVAFGFIAPILIDEKRQILAGHGRREASKIVGLSHVPAFFLDHLSESQAKAYRLAANQLTDRSTWDDIRSQHNSRNYLSSLLSLISKQQVLSRQKSTFAYNRWKMQMPPRAECVSIQFPSKRRCYGIGFTYCDCDATMRQNASDRTIR